MALGYRFGDPGLLAEALTHPSALHGGPGASYERLEFLGDAVLGFVAAEFLFHRFADRPEGELTTLRAALVRASTLAAWARALDLGQHLRVGRGVAPETSARPRVLASAFEALLGALLLDGGLEAVRAVLEPRLTARVAEVAGALKDYKSRLQELAQGERQQTPSYHVLATSGPAHARLYAVAVRVAGQDLAQGSGPSKRAAQQDAAREALERWPGQ